MSGEHEHPEYVNASIFVALVSRVGTLESSLSALAQRVAVIEDDLEDPDSPPPPPPPPTIPSGSIIVPPGSGLEAAINAAPAGSTLVLRGGTHTVDYAATSKALDIIAYPGETPVVTHPTARPDFIYFKGGPNVIRGITFKCGGPAFTDSMGSAASEVDGGHDVLYEDCTFIGDPDMTERQQLLYLRYGMRVTVRRCHFDANGTDGFGVHNYPQGAAGTPPSNVIVEDCTFTGFQVSAAVTTDWPITVRRSTFTNCRAAIQLRKAATGSILQANTATNVSVKVEGASLAAVNTWT